MSNLTTTISTTMLVPLIIFIVCAIGNAIYGAFRLTKRSLSALLGNVLSIILSLVFVLSRKKTVMDNLNTDSLYQLLFDSGLPESFINNQELRNLIAYIIMAVASLLLFSMVYVIIYLVLKFGVYLFNKYVYKNNFLLFTDTEDENATSKPVVADRALGAVVSTINCFIFFVAILGVTSSAYSYLNDFTQRIDDSFIEKPAKNSDLVYVTDAVSTFHNGVTEPLANSVTTKIFTKFGGNLIANALTKDTLAGKDINLKTTFDALSDVTLSAIRLADTALTLEAALNNGTFDIPSINPSNPDATTSSLPDFSSIDLSKPEEERAKDYVEAVTADPEMKESLDTIADVFATSENLEMIVTPDMISETMTDSGLTPDDISPEALYEVNLMFEEYVNQYEGTPEEKELLKKNLNLFGEAYGIHIK